MVSLKLDSVRVRPVDLGKYEGISSDYRSWDIQFTSLAGDIPQLVCNASGVITLDSLSSTKADHDNVVLCDVTDDLVVATSVELGGSFKLSYNGTLTSSLNFDATVNEVELALESVSRRDVSVTRSTAEVDGGYSWLVTFDVEETRGHALLGTDSSLFSAISGISNSAGTLTGTQADIEISEIQRGSFLGGTFSLGFGGEATGELPYDASAVDVKRALQDLSRITTVEVDLNGDERGGGAISSVGNRYLVTFIDPPGDVQQLRIYDSGLSGSAASARTFEYVRGVGSVEATFVLGLGDGTDPITPYSGSTLGLNLGLRSTSASVHTHTTAEELELLLEALNNIGDVTVSKTTVSTLIAHGEDPLNSVQEVEWLVTFTTRSYPVNGGNVPLLYYTTTQDDIYFPEPTRHTINITKIRSGCCDIRLTYNRGHDVSLSKTAIIVDEMPLINEIYPTTGFSEGGTKIHLRGSGFGTSGEFNKRLNISSKGSDIYCAFGQARAGIRSLAEIVNDTLATCTAPPHVPAHVVVTLQIYSSIFPTHGQSFRVSESTSGEVINLFARSTQIFVYEHALKLLAITPLAGQVDKVTVVTLFAGEKSNLEVNSDGASAPYSVLQNTNEGVWFNNDDGGDGTGLGVDRDDLRCSWSTRYIHPSMGSFEYTTFTSAWYINSSYAQCNTPMGSTTSRSSVNASDAASGHSLLGGESLPAAVSTFLNVEVNNEWYLSTSATSAVSLTKNGQQLSNALDFNFYSRPSVLGVTPRVGSVIGGTKLTVSGNNFYTRQAANTGHQSLAACRVGRHVYPATVVSSTVVTCETGPTSVSKPVHKIIALGPYIRKEVQRLEIWQETDSFYNESGQEISFRQHPLEGSFRLRLEGYVSTKSLNIRYNTTSGEVVDLLQESFPRAGNVSVTKSSRLERNYAEFGRRYNVTSFEITFDHREEDLPSLVVDIDYTGNTSTQSSDHHLIKTDHWEEGDKVLVFTDTDAGSDTTQAEVQRYTISQFDSVPETQTVRISADSAVYDQQVISLHSNSSISGFFMLSYSGTSTSLVAHDASVTVVAAALRSVPGVGDVDVTRSDTTDGFYGYDWTITFRDMKGARPSIGTSGSDLSSTSAITLEQSSRAVGSIPLGGAFVLRLGNDATNTTRDLSLETDAASMAKAICAATSMNETAIYVNKSSDGPSEYTWEITFPGSEGNVNSLVIISTSLTGDNVVGSVTSTDGSTRLQGLYDITMLGTYTMTLNISDTADAIQSKLQTQSSSFASLLENRLILVEVLDNGYFSKTIQLTYPISMGNVDEVILDVSSTGGDSPIITNVTTIAHGTYEALSGSFVVAVDGTNTSTLDYNATAEDIMDGLMALDTVSVVNISKYEGSKYHQGQQYYGSEWNITFSQVLYDNSLGIIDVRVHADTSLEKPSRIVQYQELMHLPFYTDDNNNFIGVGSTYEDSYGGDGPLVDVEVTFNGQQYTSDGMKFERIEPLTLQQIHPTSGPYDGGTRIVVTVGEIDRNLKTLLSYDVRCLSSLSE